MSENHYSPIVLSFEALPALPPKTGFGYCRLAVALAAALAAALVIPMWAKAQDTIVKQDKTNIQATILEITDEDVRYKRFDFPDGPIYNIKKMAVFMIVYKNGKSDHFDTPAAAAAGADDAARTTTKPAAASKPAHLARALLRPSATPAAPKPSPPAEEAAAAPAFSKKSFRLMLGFGATKVTYTNADGDQSMPCLLVRGAVESLGLNKKISYLSGIDNAGIGLASNNLLGLDVYNRYGVNSNGGPDGSGKTSAESAEWSKHFLSVYLFKEFDTKFISGGLLAGPSLAYTTGVYKSSTYTTKWVDNPSVDVSFLTGGLHTGQYLQKYMSTNKRDERSFFMRLGVDQFFI